MSHIASHQGTVIAVEQGKVRVQIVSVSACASCQAHSRCGFAESKEKELEIETPLWSELKVGDTVQVQISESKGMLAVVLAYLVPSVILLAGLVGFLQLMGELRAVLFTLLVIALYYIVLYFCRHCLQNKFTFTIEK